MTEAEIQHAIRLDLGREPDLRLFRNESGVATHAGRNSVQRVRYGLAKGSSDLVGVLAPAGRFIALEIKSPTGKPTERQLMWLATIRRFGGFAAIVRSVEDARAAINRARAGASE
jgi:hypothetical protein